MRRFRLGLRLAAAAMLIGVAGAALAAPGEMSVATFLAKADALKAKGMMAAFSGDLSLLSAQVQGGAKAYRARLADERKAGHPGSCPPDKARLDSNELLQQMNSYPVAARATTTVTMALADLFKKRFPCAH